MNRKIKYTIEYRNRKTVSIKILNNGIIKIIAPFGLTTKEIDTILTKKEKWISDKLTLVETRYKLKNDELLFLGDIYKMKVIEERNIKNNFMILHENTFIINVKDKSYVDITIEKWFRNQTEILIKQYIQDYLSYFNGVTPKSITIKEQKNIWGSCSYINKIFFNWRLSMANEVAIRYVVVHEMCHMIHKNHSIKFWDEVRRIMPNYEKGNDWLKNNGYLLYK